MTIVVQSLCGSLDAEAIVVKESNVCGSDRVYQQQFFESVMIFLIKLYQAANTAEF